MSAKSAACWRITPGTATRCFLTEAIWDATEGLDPVTRMQQVDLNLWLAGDILLKADKMSMAHSLELRVPFLDREVWALAAALPAAAKADARTTKNCPAPGRGTHAARRQRRA